MAGNIGILSHARNKSEKYSNLSYILPDIKIRSFSHGINHLKNCNYFLPVCLLHIRRFKSKHPWVHRFNFSMLKSKIVMVISIQVYIIIRQAPNTLYRMSSITSNSIIASGFDQLSCEPFDFVPMFMILIKNKSILSWPV